jgi:hypothetical protein
VITPDAEISSAEAWANCLSGGNRILEAHKERRTSKQIEASSPDATEAANA